MSKPRRVCIAERRWTAEQARDVLAGQRASGLSIFAFAKRENLDPQRLYFWQRRLGREAPRRDRASVEFVEVRPSAGQHVEVLLCSGRVLRVSEAIDPEALLRLCEALERPASC
jgi:hypothetical protein